MTVMDDVIITIILLSAATVAAAQPPTAPPPPYNFNPPTPTLIVLVLSALLFIGFFSIYLRLCTSSATLNPLLAAASLRRGARPPGLDPAALAAFPIFLYSEVKDLKIGKYALECAICLNEFDDEETLRLLPVCDHVFHPECIDAWLEAHVTCPVCRANLVPVTEKPILDVTPTPDNSTISVRVVPQEEEVNLPEAEPVQALDQSLDRRTRLLSGLPVEASDDDQSVGRRTRFFVPSVQASDDQSVGRRTGSFVLPAQADSDQSSVGRRTRFFFGKFPRSHSTGHSLVVVRPGEDTERFTLRFPDHVRKEVMTRALVRTATFNNAREGGSSRRGGSSRGGRSYKRWDRAVKSDRWVINVPFFSGKGTDGEGSVKGSVKGKVVTAVKLASFKCLEPSASGGVDGVGPARPAV